MTNARKNVVILTHGWTGSSVFAALLGRAGYWLGSETVQKVDYDTFENANLVALNRGILESLAPSLDHEHSFDPADVVWINRAAENMNLRPYRDFVEQCSLNGPWVWKDPRLTWTIRVWARVLDLENTSFLVLTREDMQAWISANTRRHVQSWKFTRDYNHGITEMNVRFVESLGRPVLRLSFEDLLLRPGPTLERLNQYFGLSLTMADLGSVCREPLGRRTRGIRDFTEALLVHARNFGQRDGRGRLGYEKKSVGTPRPLVKA